MSKMGWDSGAGRCVMGGVCNGVGWGGMEGGGKGWYGRGWLGWKGAWSGHGTLGGFLAWHKERGVGVLGVLGHPGADF